ncbi:MAG: hypothetical protein JO171_13405 [Paludibacterium sp.]|uniref:hypothetical protein n=2 Tax=Paludibacterium sp. TaxID=1917523 RepID=UPI0025DC6EB9|nr:hypothetical protein [Paludibacterium sp.]MBV8048151.1 hypothetical protein [Paludibacterium sp.]
MKLHTRLMISLALCVSMPVLAANASLDAKVAAVRNLHPGLSFDRIDVPTAGNMIADMMMLATIKSGAGSTASQAIIDEMTQGGQPLVVMGEKDNLAEATLERALQDGKDKLQGKSVTLVGAEEYREPLQKAAQSAGVNLEFVAVP